MICKCCNNSFDEFATESVCPNCGFENIETLGENDEHVLRLANEYRNTLLSKITSISIQANRYRWNEKKNTFDTLDSIELFDQHLTGKDYYCRFIVSDTEVHQIGVGEKQSIAVDYKFAGTPKSATVELVPVQTDKPWQFGLQINKKLQLLVALGDFSSSKYAAAVTDLDFHV